MKMIKKYFNFFLTLILAAYICPTFAKDEKWYRVEILIFETKDKQALAEEWPLNPGHPSFSNAVNLTSDPTSEFGQLLEEHYALKDAKQKIQKNYHLVLHKAWRQTINDKEHAQNIHLVGGKDFGSNNAANQFEVDGILRLTSGRYLHVDADLLLRKPMKVIPTIAAPDQEIISSTTAKFAEVSNRNQWQSEPDVRLQSFRLKESSRMRLDEIQYIDHPMYGVIIMITPEKTSAHRVSTTVKKA